MKVDRPLAENDNLPLLNAFKSNIFFEFFIMLSSLKKFLNLLGVTDCVFHPSQPWIFTAGVDNTVKLCT